jgi:hypothetical protein
MIGRGGASWRDAAELARLLGWLLVAGAIVGVAAPFAIAWGVYSGFRRGRDHEPPSGDGGVA